MGGGGGGGGFPNTQGSNSKFVNNLDELLADPSLLKKATPAEWYYFLKTGGYNPQPLGSKSSLKGILFDQGGGFRIQWGGDRYLQYHPSTSSHHGGAYWKISSGPTGVLRFDINGNPIP